MLLFKCLRNSIISILGVQCIVLDIKDFYLNTPMKQYEYMRLKKNGHPRWNHQGVQITRVSHTRWIRLLWDQKRHVRLTSSGHNSPRTSHRKTWQTQLPSHQKKNKRQYLTGFEYCLMKSHESFHVLDFKRLQIAFFCPRRLPTNFD